MPLFDTTNKAADATKCQLHEIIVDQNTENSYTHNFDGLYCWCQKTYDHDSNDVMIQCIMCQDWFHDTCIQKVNLIFSIQYKH